MYIVEIFLLNISKFLVGVHCRVDPGNIDITMSGTDKIQVIKLKLQRQYLQISFKNALIRAVLTFGFFCDRIAD